MRKFFFMLALLVSAVLVSCHSGQKTGSEVDDSIVEETVEAVDTICPDTCACDTVCVDTCSCE